MRTWIPLTILAVGLVIMATNIYIESEPGALPLLLVLVGLTWYAIVRFRRRPRHK